MKVLFLFLLLAIRQLSAFCQDSLTSEDHLKKGRKQKSTGWVLAGVSLGLNVAGVSIIMKSVKNNTSTNPISPQTFVNGIEAFTGVLAGCFVIASGIVVSIITVRQFVLAAKNKEKAKLMISTSDVPRLINQNVCYAKIPSVKLIIQF